MKKVYFHPFKGNNPSELSDIAKKILSKIIEEEGVSLKSNMPIKVHFGERGNNTFIPAKTYDGIIEYLQQNGVQTSFIETNVLYRGSRTVRSNHLSVAKEHGFIQIPIVIADGEAGENITEVKIGKEYIDKAYLGGEFANYDGFVVCSHFKGHRLAGFGGAIKQLAMGFACRKGKLMQHTQVSPIVNTEKCVACEVCKDSCDVDAIEVDEYAAIDDDKCVGCAGCIAVCPVGAISNSWVGVDFKERLAEYAYAAQLGKQNIYISFMTNITELCDCVGKEMNTIAEDVGVFASLDPVAIDTCCLDVLQIDHPGLFDSGRAALEHALKIGFGDGEYQLVEVGK